MINDAGKHEVKGEGFVAACHLADSVCLGGAQGAVNLSGSAA
jgi:hypothetical protein